MTAPILHMPGYAQLARTLRQTTEHLATELVNPSLHLPDWDDLTWTVARAVVSMQGTAVLLSNRLMWEGPEQWQWFLRQQCAQGALCDARTQRVLEQVNGALASRGCTATGLKGAAIRSTPAYASGERPMADIDILIDPAQGAAVDKALRSIDYKPSFVTRRHAIYVPEVKEKPSRLGEHVSNPLKIEVHHRVFESLPVREVDITRYVGSQTSMPGLVGYPNDAALMLHLLLHTAGNMRRHVARQIQFEDIARIARLMTTESWNSVLGEGETMESRWWLYPPLSMAARYRPDAVPGNVLASARAACPRALRRWVDARDLTDVTWSNLRIFAFPGMAWARSLGEMIRFVASRVVPDRTSREELQQSFKTEMSNRQVPWYELSHSKRIVHWVFSRPPRVQTLFMLASHFDDVNVTRRSEASETCGTSAEPLV